MSAPDRDVDTLFVPCDAPAPGVVIVHDILGLTDDTERIAGRLRDAGFCVAAPDLYGWSLGPRCVESTMRDLHRRSGRAFDEIGAVADWLTSRPECTGSVGVVGFCLGGGFALLLAADHRFAASAVNYGEVPDDVAQVLAGACPIVASFGDKDRALRGHPERLRDALGASGIAHDVKEYAGATHGFMNDHRGTLGRAASVLGLVRFDETKADDAWDRIFGFFRTHLAG